VTFGKFAQKIKRGKIQLPKNWKKKSIFLSCLISNV